MNYFYVCLFACVGSSLRYLITLSAGDMSYIGTFTVNVLGAFLLGLVTCWPCRNTALKTGLSTGLLGSFTTFSTFSMDSVLLLETSPASGMVYISATLAAGLTASYAGVKAGERLW